MKILHIEEMHKIAFERGGKCLSEVYINTITKLKWRCSKGHEWVAQPNNIKSGKWCPVCANTSQITINDMYLIAHERGGECLSKTYINGNTKLKWKCSKGHEWETMPRVIKDDKWCPECNKLTIEEMRVIALERGGKCLTEKYCGANDKLKWSCKNNHEWEATPSSIKSGSWCPVCANTIKLTIEEMHAIALERGGKCLSNSYHDNKIKLKWGCSKGHEWEAQPSNIKHGQWCPKCQKVETLTINEMREIAINRGGECLSDLYVNGNAKLKWKCSKGHEWEASPDNIKNGKKWCPVCNESKGENIIDRYLTFNKILFVRQKRFEDCKGIKNKLPFDFYLPQYNLLIEYDGEQHYMPIKFHNCSNETSIKSFQNTINSDNIKNEYCKQNNIKLIRISYLEKNNIEEILTNILILK